MLFVEPDLTVITPTHDRHKEIQSVLDQVRCQVRAGLLIEHIVVADGHDPVVESMCKRGKARYAFCEHEGHWGCAPRDHGVSLAQGRYVCFFDDDNMHHPHALLTLFAAAYGFDIGVAQCIIIRPSGKQVPIPPVVFWNGHFESGNIDTMCFCVRTELARQFKWVDNDGRRNHDYQWIKKVRDVTSRVNFVPIIIGRHLGSHGIRLRKMLL